MQYRPQTVQTTNFEMLNGWMQNFQKVLIYLEFHSVCPLVRFRTPTPSPSSECVPSNGTKRGETPSPADEGVGSPNSDDWKKKPRTLSTLWSKRTMSVKNSVLQNVEPQNDRNTNYLVLNVFLDAKLSGCITSLIVIMNSIVYCGM
jgi:hypothetical protein